MTTASRWPSPTVVLRPLILLFFGYLIFPAPADGVTWLPLHVVLYGFAVGLVVAEIRHRISLKALSASLSLNLVLCAMAGLVVKMFFETIPTIPLIFFVGFPLSLFSRNFHFVWVPIAALGAVTVERTLFLGDNSLLPWAGGFALFGVVAGGIISRGVARYGRLRHEYDQLVSNARDITERIRMEGEFGLGDLARREEMAVSAALEEERLLQRLVEVGCRLFGARSGIFLVPDGPEIFRIKAAAVSKRYSKSMIGDTIPGDKGIINLARRRPDLTFINADAKPGRDSIPFYRADLPVRSILLRVVPRNWHQEKPGALDQIQCAVYFDSDEPNMFVLDDATQKRLDVFTELVSRAMEIGALLYRVTDNMTTREAISFYARELTRTMDAGEIAEKAIDSLLKILPKCDGAAFLVNDGVAKIVHTAGDIMEGMKGETIRRQESSQIGLLIRNGNEIIFDRKRRKPSPFFYPKEDLGNVISFAAIPCVMSQDRGGKLLAALVGVSTSEGVFTPALNDLRVIADITAQALDNANTHRKVERMSRVDGLTGLYNHRTLQKVLDERIEKLGRDYSSSLAFLMVDVDFFKQVNDTYGHPVGDEVLKELSRRLEDGVRGLDPVARYGGEEFAVLLDNVDVREAHNVAEKLIKSVEARDFATTAGPLSVTISIGLALLHRGEGLSKQEFIDRADRALYRAKKEGRNRVVGFQEMG
ncbi:MAG: diguanylate cyclase [Deltaproteobacteria bacterium]|nr:diguanylate cyclase [Deltaproteobacteria bacterium]